MGESERPGTDLWSAGYVKGMGESERPGTDLWSALLCVVPFQKSIFCGGDFGSTIALDLQQKLKPFLHS